MARAHDLLDCHLHIVETRALLAHTRLSRCLGDLGEVEEDLMGWEVTLGRGGGVLLDEVKKMHREVDASLH
jgi:hypothetical protein